MWLYTRRALGALTVDDDPTAALEYAEAARTNMPGATIDVAALEAWLGTGDGGTAWRETTN